MYAQNHNIQYNRIYIILWYKLRKTSYSGNFLGQFELPLIHSELLVKIKVYQWINKFQEIKLICKTQKNIKIVKLNLNTIYCI